ILEPFGRNTAPAIIAAALEINKTSDPKTIMLVLPADHLIRDQQNFALAVKEAMVLASQAKLVTFGIQPDSPETGYGYIEAQGNQVIKFVEKPSLERAQAFLDSGRFLWNSGMFCFSVETLLKEAKEHCPDILETTAACIESSSMASAKNYRQLEL